MSENHRRNWRKKQKKTLCNIVRKVCVYVLKYDYMHICLFRCNIFDISAVLVYMLKWCKVSKYNFDKALHKQN